MVELYHGEVKNSHVSPCPQQRQNILLYQQLHKNLWLNQLISELTTSENQQITILEDNQSTIAMTHNPQFHGRSKHIDIKYHFVRDHVNNGNIRLVYCPSGDMTADMLTKGLSRENFCKLRENSGLANYQLCTNDST